MKIVFLIIVLLLQFDFAFSTTSLPLKLKNEVGDSTRLVVGIDDSATDGVDYNLGEINAPRFPPPTAEFHAALVIYDSVHLQELVWTYKDYRKTRNERHYLISYDLSVQRGDGDTLIFEWFKPFPAGIDSVKITDTIYDLDMVDINLASGSSARVNNKYVNDFWVKVWYNNPNADVQQVLGSSYKICLSPNPANDRLYIETENLISEYKIYSAIGTEIIRGQLTSSQSIDIRNLTTGAYFIELISENRKVITKGFIKL